MGKLGRVLTADPALQRVQDAANRALATTAQKALGDVVLAAGDVVALPGKCYVFQASGTVTLPAIATTNVGKLTVVALASAVGPSVVITASEGTALDAGTSYTLNTAWGLAGFLAVTPTQYLRVALK